MIAVADEPKKRRKLIRRPRTGPGASLRRRTPVNLSNMTLDQILQTICPTCRVVCKQGSTPESGASRVQYRYCPKCGQGVKVSIGQ